MSRYIYVGVNNQARRVNLGYVGVNGVARRIKKAYVGDSNGYAQQCYRLTSFTITFHANGGSGTMDTQVVYGHYPWVRCVLNTVTFTPETGYYFTGWNTQPDGSGKSFSPDSTADLFADLNLYAQWSNIYTVRYRHSNNTGGLFSNNNTGPQACYTLRIGGGDQDSKRKLGTFADDPGDVYYVPYGTMVEVAVTYKDGGTGYTSHNGRIYFNGEKIVDASSAYHAFYLTGNTDIRFDWVIAGSLVTFNAQSWWDCYITTA